MAVLIGTAVPAFVVATVQARRATLPAAAWIVAPLVAAGLQLFCVSLAVSSSNPIGAAVFCALFLFTTVYQGQLHRSTLSEPILLPGVLLAGGTGLLLAPTDQHEGLLLIVVPAALFGHLMLGTRTLAADRTRRESESLRAAIQAQIEEDHAQLSVRLADVLGANHDLGNAISIAALSASSLKSMLKRSGHLAPEEAAERLEQLEGAMHRIRQIVETNRRARLSHQTSSVASASAASTIHRIVGSLGDRFPRVKLSAQLARGVDGVRVSGGEVSLHRVLENLVINACEGDSQQTASEVTIILHEVPATHEAVITVRDNGPGFLPEQLERSITGFDTTKPHGTGLGLYTSERLIRASGGMITRRNHPEGGAEVEVRLPLANESDAGSVEQVEDDAAA